MEGFGVHTYRLDQRQGQVDVREVPLEAGARHAFAGVGRSAEDRRQGSRFPPPRSVGSDRERRVSRNGNSACSSSTTARPTSFAFDILDPTKLVPEELVPVQRIGKMTLDRNPDSFFAETEQVAFCTSHVVPGIDFTNDPLLQGRNFSYQDTQLSRLGGPNFNQIPINRPQCPFHNNQRDGLHQMQINGRASVVRTEFARAATFPKESPRRIRELPRAASRATSGACAPSRSRITSRKRSCSGTANRRSRKQHIIGAFSFELAKVETPAIRERYVADILANIDGRLTAAVARALGMRAPAENGKTPRGCRTAQRQDRRSVARAQHGRHAAGRFDRDAQDRDPRRRRRRWGGGRRDEGGAHARRRGRARARAAPRRAQGRPAAA